MLNCPLHCFISVGVSKIIQMEQFYIQHLDRGGRVGSNKCDFDYRLERLNQIPKCILRKIFLEQELDRDEDLVFILLSSKNLPKNL